VENIKLSEELVYREDFLFVGYYEALETHLMTVFVSWAGDKQI